MMSLDERLDKAEEMIQKPSFRENKGLGNEVGYYITSNINSKNNRSDLRMAVKLITFWVAKSEVQNKSISVLSNLLALFQMYPYILLARYSFAAPKRFSSIHIF